MTAYETALQLVRTTTLGVCSADENLQPLTKATRELEVIYGWADEFGNSNFVVPSGQRFNFICLEIDEFAFPAVAQKFEPLPRSWRTQRRPGLAQVWFRSGFQPPREVRRGPLLNKVFFPQYAAVPGSVVNGGAYKWITGYSPVDSNLEWLPQSWSNVVRTSARKPNSSRSFAHLTAPPEFNSSRTGRW